MSARDPVEEFAATSDADRWHGHADDLRVRRSPARARGLPELTPEEQREAALLARMTALNPDAIARLCAELSLLRAVARKAREIPYLRNCAAVRALLDRLPRPL